MQTELIQQEFSFDEIVENVSMDEAALLHGYGVSLKDNGSLENEVQDKEEEAQ